MEHVRGDVQILIPVIVVVNNVKTTVTNVISLIRPNAILVKVDFMATFANIAAAKIAKQQMESINVLNIMERANSAAKIATGLRLALKRVRMDVLTKLVMIPVGYAYMAANQATTGPLVL